MSSSSTEPTTVAFSGSCQCERISYTSTSLPTSVSWCHCVTCRKLSGAPFLPFAGVKRDGVRFFNQGTKVDFPNKPATIGALHVFAVSDTAVRAACLHCHAPLAMSSHSSSETLYVTVGTINEASMGAAARETLLPTNQIFIEQKASWYDVEKDGIRCFARFPDN